MDTKISKSLEVIVPHRDLKKCLELSMETPSLADEGSKFGVKPPIIKSRTIQEIDSAMQKNNKIQSKLKKRISMSLNIGYQSRRRRLNHEKQITKY